MKPKSQTMKSINQPFVVQGEQTIMKRRSLWHKGEVE
jgi:hypothetical protein